MLDSSTSLAWLCLHRRANAQCLFVLPCYHHRLAVIKIYRSCPLLFICFFFWMSLLHLWTGLPFNKPTVFSLIAIYFCYSSRTNNGYSSMASIVLNNSSFDTSLKHMMYVIPLKIYIRLFDHTSSCLVLFTFSVLPAGSSRMLARWASLIIVLVFSHAVWIVLQIRINTPWFSFLLLIKSPSTTGNWNFPVGNSPTDRKNAYYPIRCAESTEILHTDTVIDFFSVGAFIFCRYF